jgi:hypothetical protein
VANKELMESLLVLAVPQWIEKLKHRSFADFEARREAILESVCYKGDLLLYGSKEKGETAQLFNDLAEGLAWLALIAKGGVEFGELHWDAEFADVSDVQSPGHGAPQSQTLPPVCEGFSEAPSAQLDTRATSDGEGPGGDTDAT